MAKETQLIKHNPTMFNPANDMLSLSFSETFVQTENKTNNKNMSLLWVQYKLLP